MALDLARTNGHSKSLAELLEGKVQQLPELSPGSISQLEEFAGILRDGHGEEEQVTAYGALSHFVGLYEGRFNVPRMPEYKEALQAYEARQSLAH